MNTDKSPEPAIYAIGDLHGCHNLLIQALDWIESDAAAEPADVVFLGDYVDRGPDSRAVVETLMHGPRRHADRFTCLRGNHEQMLLDADDGEPWLGHWLDNGGTETLRSYRGAIPREHREWISSLPLVAMRGGLLFVHAGLRPSVPLEDQSSDDLLWIRDPFLAGDHEFGGLHVVHGHSPDPLGPQRKASRTNLDVGAYFTGRLCIGVFCAKDASGPARIEVVD